MSENESKGSPSCATCDVETERICSVESGRPGKGCPTLTRTEVLEAANKEYASPDIREFARQASRQEAACYANRHQKPYVLQPTKTRIVEICEFAHKMKYTRLGLAFCAGLVKEAALVDEIFKAHGFETVSALCKAGRTPKTFLDLDEEDSIRGRDESMCNPIFQAKILNHEKTHLNVLIGLCVGHDALFFKYAEAPTTVLAVKDRVTGHNPLAAIYLKDSYYKKITDPKLTGGED